MQYGWKEVNDTERSWVLQCVGLANPAEHLDLPCHPELVEGFWLYLLHQGKRWKTDSRNMIEKLQ